jgi:hypothetical protein
MRLISRARIAIAAGIVAVPLFAGACNNTKDQLLAPQQPGIILPGDIQSATGADGLYNGALGRFKSWSVGGGGNQEALWPMIALMTDEYKSSDTFSQRNEADQRSVQTNNAQVQSVYTQAQQARGYTRDAINALFQYLPTQTGKIAQMYFVLGFAELQLSEDYCNGIPFGETVDGVPNYTTPLSSADGLKLAGVHFDSALALATGADAISVNVKNAATIAKARTLVNLGQWSAAASLVASVLTSYQYVETFAQTSQDNGFWIMTTNTARYSVGDSVDATGVIKNALPFASAGDPRVTTTRNRLKPFDNQTLPWFEQTVYGRSDAIAIVNGLDARLIEAEAKLQANDIAGMMTILNALRTAPPTQGIFKPAAMTALPVPADKASATTLYFREKAFWTFSRGQRFGDLRRLVRQYGRPADQVWPSGPFHKGGNYGPDVTYPVTDNEKTNPNFTGCVDRIA